MEKNFDGDDASLGQVISAAPKEPAPGSLVSAAQESKRETEDTGNGIDTDENNDKAEVDDDSQSESNAEHADEGSSFKATVSDQEVSRLGVFAFPRPGTVFSTSRSVGHTNSLCLEHVGLNAARIL